MLFLWKDANIHDKSKKKKQYDQCKEETLELNLIKGLK